MLRLILLCTIGFFVVTMKTEAQLSEYAVPFSVTGNLEQVSDFIEMPAFNSDSMSFQEKNSQSGNLKENIFAKMFSTNITPFNSGTWQKTDEGRVWRIGIHSSKAFSLYTVFNPFKLNPGCRLFIYDPSFSEIRGSYTEKNNNEAGVFAVAPIPGDSIIIELDMPNELISFGQLKLDQIGHDFTNAFGKKITGLLKDLEIGSCEVDINCSEGAPWQAEKKAVCKMIIGGRFCTGTLIANATKKTIPYILSAFHCVLSKADAAGAVFFFNYERHSCGIANVNAGQALSGAKVRSLFENLDCALLELNEIPPISFQPYYAGWDNSATIPQSAVCIHHPGGAEKKISIDQQPLVSGTIADPQYTFDANSHWIVPKWVVGTTEGGSSGSAIFNSSHHIVGTLTGGPATCGSSINDGFCKLNLQWNKYLTDSNSQLKVWLDPKNSGIAFLNGFDPYNFNLKNCDTAWNFIPKVSLELSHGNFGNGWISGTNTYAYTQFAEKFYSSTSQQLLGAFFKIALANAKNALSVVDVKVWTGNLYPEKEIYSKPFKVSNLLAGATNFMGFDTLFTVSGNFFIGYSLKNLQPGDVFAVYHTSNQGDRGPSTMYLNNGDWKNINAATNPAMNVSLGIGITACNGKTDIPDLINIKLYPNPCTAANGIKIDVPVGIIVDRIECFETSGRAVPLSYENSEGTIIVHFNLSAGAYLLRLVSKAKPITKKFIVINN